MEPSRFRNTIFEFETGDGFRVLALPKLIRCDSIIIASKWMIDCHYKEKKAITIHSVNKFIELGKHKYINLIFIDCRLPSVESKAHKALLKLCKGKQIVFIQPPHDIRAVSSAMELLSVTNNPKLKSVTFSRYLFNRGRW